MTASVAFCNVMVVCLCNSVEILYGVIYVCDLEEGRSFVCLSASAMNSI